MGLINVIHQKVNAFAATVNSFNFVFGTINNEKLLASHEESQDPDIYTLQTKVWTGNFSKPMTGEKLLVFQTIAKIQIVQWRVGVNSYQGADPTVHLMYGTDTIGNGGNSLGDDTIVGTNTSGMTKSVLVDYNVLGGRYIYLQITNSDNFEEAPINLFAQIEYKYVK